MAITYDAPSNTITVVGGPYGFIDIYNADVAGGWGVSHRQGTNQYAFDCLIQFGDGVNATTFADTNFQVKFTLTTDSQILMHVMNLATLTLGTLVSGHITNYGGSIIVSSSYAELPLFEAGSKVYFYSVHISTTQTSASRYINIDGIENNTTCFFTAYNCVFVKCRIRFCLQLDLYNVIIQGLSGASANNNALGETAGTIQNLTIQNYGTPFYIAYDAVFSVKNVTLDTITFLLARVDTLRSNAYLINVISSAWTFTWVGTSPAAIYRQYTIDLHVTDKNNNAISGATVTLKDKNGTTVFSVATNASGDIVQQTVSRGYYDKAHGNTLQEYSPHTLTISKAGYQTYMKVFTLSFQTVWEIKLAKWSHILFANGKPVLNLVPTDPENKIILGL